MSTVYDESQLKDVQGFFNVSGCGLNSARRAPPKAREIKMETKEDAMSGMPKIDLMNFEDPQFEDSKYCLTSPRSLEACSRIGVKPVDLLYKPLAEFQEELLPQEVPLRTIYNIYDEHEQNRERKLSLCREERSRLTDDEMGKSSARRKPQVVKSARTVTSARRTQKPRLAGKKSLSKSEQNLSQGSLQRQRTAWTSSVGHTRVSKDEINNRVKELHDESMKLRKELLSRKDTRAAERKKSKTERPVTARSASKKRVPMSSLARSFSASDLSLAGTSILNRTGLRDAKPISNSKLRKALKSDAKSAVITPTDEKILELMVSRHEGEQSDIRERYLREIIWERQRKEEEAAKLLSEMRRRRMVAEENRVRDMKRDSSAVRRKKEEQRLTELQEKVLNENKRKWQTRYATQQKTKDLRSIEKMQKDHLKKRIQESNLKSLEQEEEELKGLVKDKQHHQLMTAAQKKEARLLEESVRVMMMNRSERMKFEDRWNATLSDTKAGLEALASSMDIKDDQHKSKYEQVLKRKENEIMLNRLDREKKALQAKLAQQQQDMEMEEWRDSVLTAREVADRHAKETMAQTIERRARKAHEERVKKEKDQKKNIKKIHQEVDEWKKEMENLIETKDQKSSTIIKEKELTIQQSRNLAASSQKLRDTLRNRYGGESFDQKAFKAELYNKFESGTTFNSAEKNASRLAMYYDNRSVISEVHLPVKNNLTTPRPITDLGIRKALKKDEDLRSLKIPQKDEKILALMVQKGEGEREHWRRSLHSSLAWDTQREERSHLRLEKDKNHRANIEIVREEDRQAVHIQRLKSQKKRLKKRQEQLKQLEKANKATEQALERQHKEQEEKLKKLVEKEDEYKQRQEKNWWELNSQEFQRKLQEKITNDKKRLQASEKREEMIHEESKNIADANAKERLYFTDRYVVLERRNKNSREALTVKLERRLQKAEKNHEREEKEKIKEIHKDVQKEEERLKRALTYQSKSNREGVKKAKKMYKKTQEKIQHANEHLEKAFEDYAAQLRMEREEKEQQQKQNLKRMRKETRKWNKNLQRELKKQEEKAKEKQEERSKILEKTRFVAHETRVLRNKILDTYGSENFDKKVLRAARFSSLGSRPRTQDWNTSSISLL